MRSRNVSWLSAIAFAAVATSSSAQSPELVELLQRISASSGVEASFRESKELALLALPLESRGVIYFAPPERFARFTLEPEFSALIIGNEGIRLRDGPGEPEIDLSENPVARVFTDNIIVLWSGDRERLERLYTAEFRGVAEQWELHLVPRSAPLAGVIASITLRGNRSAMNSMEIEERDGDRTITRFDSVENDRNFTPEELQQIFVAGKPLNGADGER